MRDPSRQVEARGSTILEIVTEQYLDRRESMFLFSSGALVLLIVVENLYIKSKI